MDDWLTPTELADWLKVPLSTVYDWRTRKCGPTGHKIGRHIRYRRVDVEEWVTAGAPVSTTLIRRRRAPKRTAA